MKHPKKNASALRRGYVDAGFKDIVSGRTTPPHGGLMLAKVRGVVEEVVHAAGTKREKRVLVQTYTYVNAGNKYPYLSTKRFGPYLVNRAAA